MHYNMTISLNISYRNYSIIILISFWKYPIIFSGNVLKTKLGIHSARRRIHCLQKCDGLSICANELPCLDISVAHYPLRSLQEMQTATVSLQGRWSWCGGPHGHCPPSWSSVERVMLTGHSWQSVSSPPTTMRCPRCGEQGLCWLQLKNQQQQEDLPPLIFFLSKGSNAHTIVRLRNTSAFTTQEEKNVKLLSCPLVKDMVPFKLKINV